MLYESQCSKCQKVHEYFASVDERNNTPECCGRQTERVMVTPPQVSAMIWTSHKACMVGTKWCETGEDYKRAMRDQNLIPGKEGKEEAKRARNRIEKEETQKITQATVDAFDKVAAKTRKAKKAA